MSEATREEIDQSAEDLAAEEAAMTAGFTGDHEPPEEEKPAEQPPAEEEAKPAETAQPVPEAPKPLTMEDVTALLAQRDAAHQQELKRLQDRFNGTTGQLKQTIDQLRTAKVQASGISPKAKEKLSADFPELAAMLFEDEPTPQPAATPEPQPVAATPSVDVDAEYELLAYKHPDWQQVTASPEFHGWLSTLPQRVAQKIVTSEDAAFVSSELTTFKNWKQAKEAEVNKAREAEAAKAAEEAKKKERLEAAVVPQGVPRDTRASHGEDDEEAAMAASFKAWNKRR